MNLAKMTLSWTLILTSLFWIACGSKESGKTKLTPGQGNPPVPHSDFDEKLGQANTDIEGRWISVTMTERDGQAKKSIVESEVWEIKLTRNTQQKADLDITRNCRYKDEPTHSKDVLIRSQARINSRQFEIAKSSEKTEAWGKETCKNTVKAASYNYSVNKNKGELVLIDKNNKEVLFCQLIKNESGAEQISSACGQSGPRSQEEEESQNFNVSADSVWVRENQKNGQDDENKNIYMLRLTENTYEIIKDCNIGNSKTLRVEATAKSQLVDDRIIITEPAEASKEESNVTCEVKIPQGEWHISVENEGQTLILTDEKSKMTERYYPYPNP